MSSIAQIQRATAAHFGLSREELLGASAVRRFAWPRQLAMAIAREDGHSLPKIGRHFGRHHTTVLRAMRAVSSRQSELANNIASIKAGLTRQTEARLP